MIQGFPIMGAAEPNQNVLEKNYFCLAHLHSPYQPTAPSLTLMNLLLIYNIHFMDKLLYKYCEIPRHFQPCLDDIIFYYFPQQVLLRWN